MSLLLGLVLLGLLLTLSGPLVRRLRLPALPLPNRRVLLTRELLGVAWMVGFVAGTYLVLTGLAG